MRFTKSDIEEIARRLALLTKRDSEFPDAEIPLDQTERVPIIQYMPIVQDYENRLLSLADLRSLVLADTDQTAIGCILRVACTTENAEIRINGQVATEYVAYYGEVVDVKITADGYDTWDDVVTMTQDHLISITLNRQAPSWEDAFAALEDRVDDIEDAVGNIGIEDNGAYFTLTIGGKSVPFYSKPQVDALLAGGGSGDVVPDDPEDAYLHFTKNEFKLDEQGNAITTGGISIEANIPWIISAEEMPDQEQDEQSGTDTSTALNVYPTAITLEIGKTEQIKEV